MGELSKSQILTEGENPLTSLPPHSFCSLNKWLQKCRLIAVILADRNQQRGSNWLSAPPTSKSYGYALFAARIHILAHPLRQQLAQILV